MKYVHNETGEVWTGQPCTSRTSNFYLLAHEEKVALGWSIVEEPPVVTPPMTAEEKLSEVKLIASQLIIGKYPLHRQVNAALGLYTDMEVAEMKMFIQDIRSKVTSYENRIASGDLDFEVSF